MSWSPSSWLGLQSWGQLSWLFLTPSPSGSLVHGALQSQQPGAAALVDQLVECATPLLAALNRLTQVYEDLARRHAARSRKQLLDMMSEIQAIAKQARIVAFNAQIVASRAQGAGHEFSVVSAEMSHVTSRIDELVREALRSNGA